ncbi:glycosyltransferase family 2 protein [Agathobacter rectalis]|jgi:glycosyltransferase involved in cell wall biosynthesis|uniref:glycosyltransferase family 2 protein n=1 Tax=Agathobacter rectalis TaxID=39491 RepID=UPI0027D3148B|nr:glycosyltransferase family 2 protein [Agathobacter rectalis]
MKQNLISVIMPVYKTEEIYLRRAIESAIHQSYQNLEIVIVDDGAPETCAKLLDIYAENDERVQVLHKINGGVSSARNQGLKVATGDYILFMDSDDELENNAIEKLVEISKNTCSDITVCSCKHTIMSEKKKNDVTKKYIRVVEQREAIHNLTYNIHVFEELEPTAVWGKLYKKRIVENIRFNENMAIGEDFIFNYFAILNTKKVTYCSQKLYIYNYVETSMMHNKEYSPMIMKSFYELVKFDGKQKNTRYSNDVVVRCVNIAFTLYLKVPENYSEDCKTIEEYIKRKRKKVIMNCRISKKLRASILISLFGMKRVRYLYQIFS